MTTTTAQQIVSLDNSKKQPSETLIKLTEDCVSQFGKLNITVNKALEQGRLEGFSDMDVGDMIRKKLLAAGYSRMTVSRALPPSAKHIEKSPKRRDRNILLRSSDSSNNNNNNMIKFEAVVASKGEGRKIINIPHAFHAQLGDRKKVTVTIS
jgi:NAD(P)-dependent dehydrogenase (short-subunit alcohol dehydrogenase family)